MSPTTSQAMAAPNITGPAMTEGSKEGISRRAAAASMVDNLSRAFAEAAAEWRGRHPADSGPGTLDGDDYLNEGGGRRAAPATAYVLPGSGKQPLNQGPTRSSRCESQRTKSPTRDSTETGADPKGLHQTQHGSDERKSPFSVD
jgi:hypothetical protein